MGSDNLPVLALWAWSWARASDPAEILRHAQDKARVGALVARLDAGEAPEDVFGPYEDWGERLDQFRVAHPEIAVRYNLPRHLHWMGDGVHDHKMPHVNGDIAWYPNSAVCIPF